MSIVPSTWILTTLGDVAEVHDNLREPVNSRDRANRQGIYPYFGATGQVGWIDDYRQDGEYVLLGEDGAPFFNFTRDKAYIVSGKCWVNNHAHVLKGKEGILLNKYLLHMLNATDYRGYANGTTRLKLTQGAMVKIPVVLPPLSEQTRIVAKLEELLSELDAGIASLQRAKTNLKRYRAAVLKAAVEGKLTEEWRKHNPPSETGEELLARILKERRAKWGESQLKKYAEQGKTPPKNWQDKYPEPAKPDVANLPELSGGWSWASLEQLSWNSSYGTSSKCSPDNTGIPVIRIPNIQSGRLNYGNLKYATDDLSISDDEKLKLGDLLIIRTNGSKALIGRSALIDRELSGVFYYASYLIRFRLMNIGNLPEWVASLWNESSGRAWIETRAATSAGQHNISMSVLCTFPIPLPALSEQKEITSEISRRLSQAEAAEKTIEQSLARASRLRQSILKRAFEGRLVPQDPNDEPASALLDRIRAERTEAPKKRAKAIG